MALFEPDYNCSQYTNPIARWMGNCPDIRISPIVMTPAAPRSVAEMTSGLWTPDEAVRLTWEKIAAEKQRQRELGAAGDWQMPIGTGGGSGDTPKGKISTEEWILLGGLALIGLTAVRNLTR